MTVRFYQIPYVVLVLHTHACGRMATKSLHAALAGLDGTNLKSAEPCNGLVNANKIYHLPLAIGNEGMEHQFVGKMIPSSPATKKIQSGLHEGVHGVGVVLEDLI